MIINIPVEYMKVPLHKYTFKPKVLKEWVESNVEGLVLNLFAGEVKLDCSEIRIDSDCNRKADFYVDALDFVKDTMSDNFVFNTIILDPPYSYRKSMEMYNKNHVASRFNQLKDCIPNIISSNDIVITFGYHSISMGIARGFKQEKILLMSHGGAIHDTIAVIERKIYKEVS